MNKIQITVLLLILFHFSFGQNSKLYNIGTYNEFVTSLGKCIENKNINEIKRSFLVLTNGKIIVEKNHEALYLNTAELCQKESILKFGKRLQLKPKKIRDVTKLVQKKAKSHYGLKIEKALKIYLNSRSYKPHLHEVVVVLYKGKWFLVDY